MKADCRNKLQKAQEEEFLLRVLRIFAAITFLIQFPSNVRADDVITNIMSPIVSYQYPDNFVCEVLTNGGISSAIISYQYPQNLVGEVLTNGGIMSPIVSYQYYEWPGNDILSLQSSPVVSYFYNIGAASPNVPMYGQVLDSSGTPLANATITASVLQTSQATAQSASDGTYNLPPLPAGVYVLKASLAGYASSTRALTLNSATAQQYFTLSALALSPTVVQTTRQPSAAFTQPPGGPMGSTLLVFNGTQFIPIGAENLLSSGNITIVLTHGWISPYSSGPQDVTGWPTSMALNLWTHGINSTVANILAWDWSAAASGPLPPEENAPSQGTALGLALQSALGISYAQPLHFIGHSLGTIVNAAAANYVHGDQIAQESVSPHPWSATQTHMTLFDQAELSRIANLQVLFDGYSASLGGPAELLSFAENALQGWKPSMPVQSAWADNYISLVGFYLPNTLNVALEKAEGYAGVESLGAGIAWYDIPWDLLAIAHGYPMTWYAMSIVNPTDTTLGFQQSYEYDRLKNLSDFPSASFPVGDAYHQTSASSDQLATEPLPYTDIAQAIVPLFGNGADAIVQGVAESGTLVVQAVGNVTSDIENTAQQAVQSLSQGTEYLANVTANAGQGVVNLWDSAVLHLTMQTGPASQSQQSGGLAHPNIPQPADASATNTPALAWVPVQIPANALAMAFDFTLSGNPEQDWLVCGIGASNLFSLQAQYVPTNVVSACRLIDVSSWAGQQVELFFGFMGGTSTNATLQVDNIRFYSLQPPSLAIQNATGGIVLSWPSSAAGYVLQSATSLSSPDWGAVTNVPVITANSYMLTIPYPAAATFFRLWSQ